MIEKRTPGQMAGGSFLSSHLVIVMTRRFAALVGWAGYLPMADQIWSEDRAGHLVVANGVGDGSFDIGLRLLNGSVGLFV